MQDAAGRGPTNHTESRVPFSESLPGNTAETLALIGHKGGDVSEEISLMEAEGHTAPPTPPLNPALLSDDVRPW